MSAIMADLAVNATSLTTHRIFGRLAVWRPSQAGSLTSADWRNRRGIRRQRFRRRHGAWRSWFGWGWTFWHWFSLTKSFLLEPLAVNLVNAHKAPNEIYIFLISKSARFPRPGKLTRRFGVIRIISGIPLNSGPWRERLSFIDQNRVIDRDAWKSAEVSNEYLSARKGFIQFCVHLLLVSRVVLVNNSAVAWPQVNRPAKTDVCPQNFPACIAHFAQIGIPRENNALILGQRSGPGLLSCN